MSRIATLSSVRQWHQEVMQIVVQREVQRLKHEFTFLTSCQRSAEISSTKSKQSSPTTPTKPSRTKKLKNKLSALNLKADPSTCTSSSTSSKISTTSNVSSKVAAIPPNRYVVEPFVFLVGTKRDQLSESSLRFVDSEAIKIANALKAEYWPVSALTGFNVPDLFGRVAALTFQEVTLSEIESQRDQPNVSSDRIDRYPNKNDDVVRLESSPKKRKSIRCMIRMVKLPKLPKIPKTLKAFTDRYMRSNKPPANVIIT